jgi:hypothetical protein
MSEEKMSQLRELWNAIGNKKEKEFHKKYPDFEFTMEKFDETLKHLMRYCPPGSLDDEEKPKKKATK